MIGLGCDHGGLELKKTVMEYLDSRVLNTRISVHTQVTLAIILFMARLLLTQ